MVRASDDVEMIGILLRKRAGEPLTFSLYGSLTARELAQAGVRMARDSGPHRAKEYQGPERRRSRE